MQLTDKHRQYWQKNLRITGILLAIWFFVTFVLAYFARDLNFTFFGWPFSFWVALPALTIVTYSAFSLALEIGRSFPGGLKSARPNRTGGAVADTAGAAPTRPRVAATTTPANVARTRTMRTVMRRS